MIYLKQGRGANCCLNKPSKKHKSAMIYFEITNDEEGYCVQKCQAGENTEDRVNGKCKAYRSEKMHVPENVLSMLFS